MFQTGDRNKLSLLQIWVGKALFSVSKVKFKQIHINCDLNHVLLAMLNPGLCHKHVVRLSIRLTKLQVLAHIVQQVYHSSRPADVRKLENVATGPAARLPASAVFCAVTSSARATGFIMGKPHRKSSEAWLENWLSDWLVHSFRWANLIVFCTMGTISIFSVHFPGRQQGWKFCVEENSWERWSGQHETVIIV